MFPKSAIPLALTGLLVAACEPAQPTPEDYQQAEIQAALDDAVADVDTSELAVLEE